MASIVFDEIAGVDKKSSETDIDRRFATKLENLSTTKKPGALSKDGAYTDVSSSLVGSALPAGITIKSLFELGVTSPANTDIYLAHGTDANSDNRVYAGQIATDTDISQLPAADWQELTEHEGRYTIDTGAGDTISSAQIVISSSNARYGSLSTTDDYYNDWILWINIGGTDAATIVLDYTFDGGAATKTFDVLSGALTGIANADFFTLSRYNLMADPGLAAGSGTPPRFADIVQIDDVLRWKQRENAAVGMTGNAEQFPTQYNLWYGYIKRTFGASGDEFDDFWLDVEQPLQPSQGLATLSNATTGGSLPATTNYTFNAAYVYDGIQISGLSPLNNITTGGTGTNKITAELNIPYSASYDSSAAGFIFSHSVDSPSENPTYYNLHTLSRRVTAVRIYVTGGSLTGTTANPDFLTERVISSAVATTPDFTLGADKVLTDTITFSDEADVDGTYLVDTGQTNLRPNFKYGTALGSHFIGASIRTDSGDRRNNALIASIVDGNGVATIDAFGASNIINLGFYGSKQITGIHVLGDEGVDTSPKARALVFADDDYYILSITSGASFSFDLDNIGQQEGLVAPDSLVYAEGQLYGVSRNGFRMFTPQGTRIIGEGFKNDFDALTTPSEGLGAYFKKERLVIFHFPTDGKTFAIDLLSEKLNMLEYSYNDAFVWMTKQRTGNLLAMTGSKIFQIGSGSDQDGTKIVPLVRTKRFTARELGGQDGDVMTLTEGYISYLSDTGITMKVYLGNSAAADVTLGTTILPAQTTEDDVFFRLPKGTNADEIEVEVTLDSTQKLTNTSFRFNRLRLDGYSKRRIS